MSDFFLIHLMGTGDLLNVLHQVSQLPSSMKKINTHFPLWSVLLINVSKAEIAPKQDYYSKPSLFQLLK
jgi:hypothetical protein